MRFRTWATSFGVLTVMVISVKVGRQMGWPTGASVGSVLMVLFLAVKLVFVDAERWQGEYRDALGRGPMHIHDDPDTGLRVTCYDNPCHYDEWFGTDLNHEVRHG